MTQSDLDFTVPYVKSSETSRDAAVSMREHTGRLEGYVLAAIKSTGGSTCDELEILCGLSHQCCSARVRGLALKSLIADSGEKRLTRSGRSAVVWTAR